MNPTKGATATSRYLRKTEYNVRAVNCQAGGGSMGIVWETET